MRQLESHLVRPLAASEANRGSNDLLATMEIVLFSHGNAVGHTQGSRRHGGDGNDARMALQSGLSGREVLAQHEKPGRRC